MAGGPPMDRGIAALKRDGDCYDAKIVVASTLVSVAFTSRRRVARILGDTVGILIFPAINNRLRTGDNAPQNLPLVALSVASPSDIAAFPRESRGRDPSRASSKSSFSPNRCAWPSGATREASR